MAFALLKQLLSLPFRGLVYYSVLSSRRLRQPQRGIDGLGGGRGNAQHAAPPQGRAVERLDLQAPTALQVALHRRLGLVWKARRGSHAGLDWVGIEAHALSNPNRVAFGHHGTQERVSFLVG